MDDVLPLEDRPTLMVKRQNKPQADSAPDQDPQDPLVSGDPTVRSLVKALRPPDDTLFGSSPDTGSSSVQTLSVSILLRSKGLFFGIFAIVCAALITCIWTFVVPKYRATATIRVSPVVSRIVFKTEDNGIVPLYRSFIQTQVSIIKGPRVLENVLDCEGVRETKWNNDYRPSLIGGVLSPIDRLQNDLTVTHETGTELIDVSFTSTNPKDATIIVNAIVDQYKEYIDATSKESETRRLKTLLSERDALQKEIEGLIAAKFQLSSRLGTVDPENRRLQLITNLSAMESEGETITRKRAVAQWNLERILAADKTKKGDAKSSLDEAVDGASSERYIADPEWRTLHMGLTTSRHQLQLERQRYGDSHPRIKELIADVEHARHLLSERQTQLDEHPRTSSPNPPSLSNQEGVTLNREELTELVEQLGYQSDLLNKAIDQKYVEIANASEIAKKIAHYDEEIRFRRELYETVRSRLMALEMEGKAPARISVAAYAAEPSRPNRDNRLRLSVMALFGSMVIAFVAVYFRNTIDPRIYAVTDIQGAVGVPFLGQLPPIPVTEDLLTNRDPIMAESMRAVRTVLLERIQGTGGCVVLITSSSSRTGKSSVSLLLGKSLAQLGKKTLLVEADLREPSLSNRLHLETNAGLAALLNGRVDDVEVIVSTCVVNLDVLPAGMALEHFDAELLANGAFSACLERWKHSYDFVLLDSPPVLPVADAQILSGQACGTIMVERAIHSRRAEAVQAYTDLSASGGRLFGTILIRSREGAGYGGRADYLSLPES